MYLLQNYLKGRNGVTNYYKNNSNPIATAKTLDELTETLGSEYTPIYNSNGNIIGYSTNKVVQTETESSYTNVGDNTDSTKIPATNAGNGTTTANVVAETSQNSDGDWQATFTNTFLENGVAKGLTAMTLNSLGANTVITSALAHLGVWCTKGLNAIGDKFNIEALKEWDGEEFKKYFETSNTIGGYIGRALFGFTKTDDTATTTVNKAFIPLSLISFVADYMFHKDYLISNVLLPKRTLYSGTTAYNDLDDIKTSEWLTPIDIVIGTTTWKASIDIGIYTFKTGSGAMRTQHCHVAFRTDIPSDMKYRISIVKCTYTGVSQVAERYMPLISFKSDSGTAFGSSGATYGMIFYYDDAYHPSYSAWSHGAGSNTYKTYSSSSTTGDIAVGNLFLYNVDKNVSFEPLESITTYLNKSISEGTAKRYVYNMRYGDVSKTGALDNTTYTDRASKVNDTLSGTATHDYNETMQKLLGMSDDEYNKYRLTLGGEDYVAVPYPTKVIDSYPAYTDTDAEAATTVDIPADTDTDTQAASWVSNALGLSKDLVDSLTKAIDIALNPQDPTGSGDTPAIVVPIGSTTAMWSIYNPTNTQMKQFSGYLWSSTVIDQFIKIVQNPMDAIISLHKVFGTPEINGTGEIKVGYLSSGVTDVKIVSKQYITVDCGSVDLLEYFGNVFDYGNYTSISLYLPFIGFVSISNADVLRSTITITYQIDVITGTCIANVNVKRDGVGGILYQYTGNCSVHYPLTSGNYMNFLSNTLAGAASGFFSMGVAGAVAGGIGGAMTPINYSRSGSFSGNAGAMAIKKPYFVISRPITAISTGAGHEVGFPSNTYAQLNNYVNTRSFVKVLNTKINTLSVPTEQERTDIINKLKQGVVIN